MTDQPTEADYETLPTYESALEAELRNDIGEMNYVYDQIRRLQEQADELREKAKEKAIKLYEITGEAIVAPGVMVSRKIGVTIDEPTALAWILERPLKRGEMLQISPERMSFVVGLMMNDPRYLDAFEVNKTAYSAAYREQLQARWTGEIEEVTIPVKGDLITLSVSFTQKDMSAIPPKAPDNAYLLLSSKYPASLRYPELEFAQVNPRGEIGIYDGRREAMVIDPLDPTWGGDREKADFIDAVLPIHRDPDVGRRIDNVLAGVTNGEAPEEPTPNGLDSEADTRLPGVDTGEIIPTEEDEARGYSEHRDRTGRYTDPRHPDYTPF